MHIQGVEKKISKAPVEEDDGGQTVTVSVTLIAEQTMDGITVNFDETSNTLIYKYNIISPSLNPIGRVRSTGDT